MHKYLLAILVTAFSTTTSWAGESPALDGFSPSLRSLLKEHPENVNALNEIFVEAFSNRVAHLYYFYTQNQSLPKAQHYYPEEGKVFIMVKADQLPADEFLCIFDEAINSEGEKRFDELYDEARSGTIGRTDFAREIIRQEFVAVKRTRDLLGKLKFTKKEKSASHFYKDFAECPDNFEDFLTYVRSLDPARRDQLSEYEKEYDTLRKEVTKGNP